MNKLEGKTIVITGGAGVLCRTIGKVLAQNGAQLALIGRTLATLQEAVAEIHEFGGTAIAVPADVLNRTELSNAKDRINKELGPCDILINGAGGNHPSGTASQSFFNESDASSSFFDLDSEGAHYVFDLNFMGTFLPTQIFAKDMIGREGCSVLNISSVSAFKPLTKVSTYSAAKAAINNFTQWLAVHLAKEHIRVNAIAPGFYLTQQNKELLTHEDGSLTERGEKIIEHTPMGRFGNPDDLAGGALWLCGNDSQFVTGVVLPIDGGFTAYAGI